MKFHIYKSPLEKIPANSIVVYPDDTIEYCKILELKWNKKPISISGGDIISPAQTKEWIEGDGENRKLFNEIKTVGYIPRVPFDKDIFDMANTVPDGFKPMLYYGNCQLVLFAYKLQDNGILFIDYVYSHNNVSFRGVFSEIVERAKGVVKDNKPKEVVFRFPIIWTAKPDVSKGEYDKCIRILGTDSKDAGARAYVKKVL